MKSYLEKILQKVHKGELAPDEAVKELKSYPYEDLGIAKIDHHRELRRGFPEIVLGLGKTREQIIKISQSIIRNGSNLLVTKVEPEDYQNIKKDIPEAQYNTMAKTIYYKIKTPPPGSGKIAIITAGTSDIPIAEEAAVTCDILGNDYEKIYDVLTKYCTSKRLLSFVDASLIYMYNKHNAEYILSFDSHFDNITNRKF